MRITWYGHAAFRIETRGLRLILDPYKSPDSGGYEPIRDGADVVVVSHINDRYHSHIGQIAPPFRVIHALAIPHPEGLTCDGLKLETVRVHETPERKLGDEVTILHFRTEGLHVVFLGDLGHALDEPELAPLVGADVVLAPAGGPPTIDYPELRPLIEAIGPSIIVPMHFKTPRINLEIQPVERFLEWFPGIPVDRPGRSWLEVTSDKLPQRPRIVLLDHAR